MCGNFKMLLERAKVYFHEFYVFLLGCLSLVSHISEFYYISTKNNFDCGIMSSLSREFCQVATESCKLKISCKDHVPSQRRRLHLCLWRSYAPNRECVNLFISSFDRGQVMH